MNKLLTEINGGFPFSLNDLRWQDDAYRLALTDICRGLSANTSAQDFILFGCGLTLHNTQSPYYSVDEGAVFHAGEVYHVYPHNIPWVTNQEPYITFPKTYDPTGNVIFSDSSTHNVYEIRKAVFVLSLTAPTEENVMLENVDTLSYILAQHTHAQYATKQQEAWHQVGASGEPAFASGWQNVDATVYNPLSFMKDTLGFIHIKGAVMCPSSPLSGWSNKITTLPTAYHPSKTMYTVGFLRDGEQKYGTCLFRIDADGSLWYNHVSTTVGVPSIIDLGHIVI